MRQEVYSNHKIEDGNPTGGWTKGTGIQIDWQWGPLGRDEQRQEPNGAFVEGVIRAALDRLEFYQSASAGKFACVQNARAVEKLEQALHDLDERTIIREHRGVEGTHTP